MAADDRERAASGRGDPACRAEEERGHAAFGPGGYLPERAAKRARKIVLREQMGMQWPIAAVAAAVVVLLAGTLYLVYGQQPPDAPFTPVIDIAEVDPRGAEILAAGEQRGHEPAATDLAVVRAGAGVRVYRLTTDAVVWCEASGRLETPGGAVWNSNGRLVGGPGASLEPVPAQVFDGVLYVHADAPSVGLPPDRLGERPSCAGRPGLDPPGLAPPGLGGD